MQEPSFRGPARPDYYWVAVLCQGGSPLCTALPSTWEMLIYTQFIDFPLAKGHRRLCKKLYTLSMIIQGDKYFWFTQEPKYTESEINKACKGWEREKLETDRGAQQHVKGHWHHLPCASIPCGCCPACKARQLVKLQAFLSQRRQRAP